MLKRIIHILIIIFIRINSFAQLSYQWINFYNCTPYTNNGYTDMKVDDDGNVYTLIAGYDSTVNNFLLMLLKYGSDGALLWKTSFLDSSNLSAGPANLI